MTSEISEPRTQLKVKFEKALSLYYQREFIKELNLFEEIIQTDPEDKASFYNKGECLEFMQNLPEED